MESVPMLLLVASRVLCHPLSSRLNGGRGEESVVRLAGIENKRLDHEIRPPSFLKVAESLGAASNDPSNGRDQFAFRICLVYLLFVADSGVLLFAAVRPFNGDLPTGSLV